jgi:hypothetical protein
MDGRLDKPTGRGGAACPKDAPLIKLDANPPRSLVAEGSSEEPYGEVRRFVRGKRSHSRIMPLFHQLPLCGNAPGS